MPQSSCHQINLAVCGCVWSCMIYVSVCVVMYDVCVAMYDLCVCVCVCVCVCGEEVHVYV